MECSGRLKCDPTVFSARLCRMSDGWPERVKERWILNHLRVMKQKREKQKSVCMSCTIRLYELSCTFHWLCYLYSFTSQLALIAYI